MESNKITFEQYIGFEKRKIENKEGKKKVPVTKIVSFVILCVFCVIWIMPFILLGAGAFRSIADANHAPSVIFGTEEGFSIENFILVFGGSTDKLANLTGGSANSIKDVQIFRWLLNSCISAIGGTLLYLLVASFAAYAFTFTEFKFRNLIFGILIATMVIPGTATTVGCQTLVFGMSLDQSLLALILPGLGGVYGMYLIRTFFSSIPKDLIESARMDGYSNMKIFFKIVLPLGKTVLFVQGLFGFMGGWNDLVWPQMLYGAKSSTDLWTLQVGMAYIVNNFKMQNTIGVSLACGVICILPVLIVYLFAQNYIIEGMASAGIKR